MVRISGVVRVATVARQHLQLGILPQEVEKFQKFVTMSVQQIEHLCASSNAHPSQLPTPSRKAYDYLKQIDLNNLPLTNEQQPQNVVTLKLKNVIKQERNLHQQMWEIAVKDDLIWELLLADIKEHVEQIEAICDKNQLTPASLPSPSRSAYAWMKFLTYEKNLDLHIHTLRRALEISQKIKVSQKCDNRQLFVQLCNNYLLYKCKNEEDKLITVEMNEGFIYASDEIITAVMEVALLGKNTQLNQKVRSFGVAEEYSDVLVELDLIAQMHGDTGKGKYYDLDQLFEKINVEYFGGEMIKPRLFWNDSLTTRKFGHYEPARNRVVISQTLDDSRLPEFVVEYVLYHELLHKFHGVKWVNGKPMVHTPEFRLDEKKFKFYHQGEAYLSAIARGDRFW